MFKTIRRGKMTKLVLVAGGLWLASASSVQALDWCSGRRSSNVIDCRSGTCVALPGGEPSFWEVVKCEWNKLWNSNYPA